MQTELDNLKCKIVFFATDMALLLVAYALSFVFAEAFRQSFQLIPGEYGLIDAPTDRHLIFSIVALALVAWAGLGKGHYVRRSPFWQVLRDMFVAVSFAALCDAAIMYMMKLPFARLAWALGWLSVLALLPAGRLLAVRLLTHLGWWRRPVVLLGNGDNAIAAWRAIESDTFVGYAVVHLASLTDEKMTEELASLAEAANVRNLHGIEAVQNFVLRNPLTKVVIALEALEMLKQTTAIHAISRLGAELLIVPSLKGLPLYGTEPLFFFGHEVLLLRIRNNLARWFPSRVKRLFDFIVASIGLIAIAPFLLWVVIRVRADGGPAIYAHPRVGQQGVMFSCYKFRTMVPNSQEVLTTLLDRDPATREEWGRDFKLKDDPRITKIGGFLRKTSLDELPQLFNVIRGDMSLVGPRPIIPDEVSRYGDNASFYFEARPGITGLWQVSGRNDVDYTKRVLLDTWYVQNWSLLNDIIILLKTIPVVWQGKGAY